MNVSDWVPIEVLVPDSAARWRPIFSEALQYVFTHLSPPRLSRKVAEQLALPPGTAPEQRLLVLISQMPGLQKIGQVLARNRRIPPSLRTALIELENGIADVTAPDIRAAIQSRLGDRLDRYEVEIEPELLSEASVSAVIRFTWRRPDRERQRAVFKVMKPHVPGCFAEDLTLLRRLGEHLADRDVNEALTEVRLLLERELDFRREQTTLAEAAQIYRGTLGIRVPEVIPELCADDITAMSEEIGVKVTSAVRGSPIRRRRIADQILEALIAVPLFSNRSASIFHADPHAGNLLYGEANRELIVLDWALAERLPIESRRQVILLAVMMILQNRAGIVKAIEALRRRGPARVIDREVKRFFEELPPDRSPGVLDAMRLLDKIALHGVHFDPALFLFRKSLFTLDGVLQDVAGMEVRMDEIIVRHFLTRWAASFGMFYSPLALSDFISIGVAATGYGRASRGRRPSPRTISPRPRKPPRPAPPRPRSRPAR